jgi:L-2,4-diaminobutyric acid acetyltransferase
MAPSTDTIELRHPIPADGPALQAIARVAGGLDVNPTYAYALWAREFADTTIVATLCDEPVGYAMGFRRPGAPSTLFVWQMAVCPEQRGARLALRMLHDLVDRAPTPSALEATVAHDNRRSLATFARFADDRGASITLEPLFDERELGPGHQPEDLLRVEPLTGRAR